MTIRFQINRDTAPTIISTEEWEALEMAQDGDVKIYRLRPVLARFMIGDDGKPLEHKQALRVLGKLPFSEFMSDVFAAFFDALKGAAVPNMSGGMSSLPSEVGQASESPAGSGQ